MLVSAHQPFLIAPTLRTDVLLNGASHGLGHRLEPVISLYIDLMVSEGWCWSANSHCILNAELQLRKFIFMLLLLFDDTTQLLTAVQ